MKLAAIGLLLVSTLIGCQNAEPVKMDQGGVVVPSSTGACQDYVAGRMVAAACPK